MKPSRSVRQLAPRLRRELCATGSERCHGWVALAQEPLVMEPFKPAPLASESSLRAERETDHAQLADDVVSASDLGNATGQDGQLMGLTAGGCCRSPCSRSMRASTCAMTAVIQRAVTAASTAGSPSSTSPRRETHQSVETSCLCQLSRSGPILPGTWCGRSMWTGARPAGRPACRVEGRLASRSRVRS